MPIANQSAIILLQSGDVTPSMNPNRFLSCSNIYIRVSIMAVKISLTLFLYSVFSYPVSRQYVSVESAPSTMPDDNGNCL